MEPALQRDAGSLQKQRHQHDHPAAVANNPPATTTAMDTQQGKGGATSMAPQVDDDATEAGAQPKCPNLRGILRVAENRRVLMSVIPTLTLAIMGG